MSTRILEVSYLNHDYDWGKCYITSDKASETFRGIHPGDVIKVVDIDSGDTLSTGIMCTSPRSQACSDCIFNIAARPLILSVCEHVPCINMLMIPRRPENVLEDI